MLEYGVGSPEARRHSRTPDDIRVPESVAELFSGTWLHVGATAAVDSAYFRTSFQRASEFPS